MWDVNIPYNKARFSVRLTICEYWYSGRQAFPAAWWQSGGASSAAAARRGLLAKYYLAYHPPRLPYRRFILRVDTLEAVFTVATSRTLEMKKAQRPDSTIRTGMTVFRWPLSCG
jgi:hypothetical protein